MVAPPKRNLIEFEPEARCGEAGDQQLIVAQFLASANSQRLLTGKAKALQFDGTLWGGLRRHDQPLVGFRYSCSNGAIDALLLSLRLLNLVRREVKRLRLVENGLPGSDILIHGNYDEPSN